MALRVLLADESSTIKKVFQLALQDFAVEVKPVNVGLDVAAVAESFLPDIIFADVLLQKKNGYDVSLEIKQNSGLSKTPVVLMWSGFLDLDEDKMQASGADAQLEKPFDVKSLRALIQNLVPKTKDQNLSSYLSFPKLPDFEEKAAKTSPSDEPYGAIDDASQPPVLESNDAKTSGWNMESFEPANLPNVEDDFQELSLKNDGEPIDDEPLIPPGMDIDKDLLVQDSDEDSPWEQKDLGKYRIDGDRSLSDDESEPDIKYVVPEGHDNIDMTGQMEDLDVEIETPEGDGSPSGLRMGVPDREIPVPEEIFVPEGQKRGKTVVLNFSLDGDDEDSSYETTSGVDPSAMLKQINAQLNEEAIADIIRAQAKGIIEEQTKKIIEDAVWKVLPELARQIVEREIKNLIEDDEVEL